MARRKKWQVAFDPITGSHQVEATTVYDDGIPLEPNIVDRFRFESSLKYDRCERKSQNRSLHFIFKDDDGREFTMFLSEFDKAIPFMVGGRLTGTFGFMKKGVRTGLQFESTLPKKLR